MVTGCTEENNIVPVDTQELAVLEEEKTKESESEPKNNDIEENKVNDYDDLKAMIIEKFDNVSPNDWGENIDGVITEIDSDEKIVALTFDACDGTPDSYDEELIQFLIEEKVPATLFIGGQWIEENQETFINLSNNPIFEIANHGYVHEPLSITGNTAYDIQGTENVEEVFDEIYKNQVLIKELTGDAPKYFRSGTAHYDDVAIEIIDELGLRAVNYNVLGDAGGTFSKSQISETFETAEKGSIFLFHMNQPHTDIGSGVKEGVRILKEKGFEFVQLGEYDQFLK